MVEFANLSDPSFPGLADAIDMAFLSDKLSAAMAAHDQAARLENLRVEEISYDPGQKCLILYRLQARDGNGKKHHIKLAGNLRTRSENFAVLPDLEPANASMPLLPAMMDLPESAMTLYRFPYDGALPQLASCLDNAVMLERFKGLFEGRDVRVRKVSSELLGYTPLARAAIRYDLLLESIQNEIPERRTLVGKIDAKRSGAYLYASGRALWRTANQSLRVTPAVGFVPDANMWVQEFLPGVPLGELADNGRFIKWARKTALAAATLHQLQVPLNSVHDAKRESKSINRWRDVICVVAPELGSYVESLSARINSHLEEAVRPSAPVHADLHPANVLVHNDQVTLIDCDNMAFGDPLKDVGRFIASLRASSFRIHGSIDGFDRVADAFVDMYQRRSGGVDKRLKIFEASALITAAAAGFRFQRPNWRQFTLEILQAAEHSVASYEAATTSLPQPVAKNNQLVYGDADIWTQDREFLKASLFDEVSDVYGFADFNLSPLGCRTARHHVSYPFDLIGKGDRENENIPLIGYVQSLPKSQKSAFKRLSQLFQLANGPDRGWRMERPVAYVRSLNMTVFEREIGTPLVEEIHSGRGQECLTHIANCFAHWHVQGFETEKSLRAQERIERNLENLKSLPDNDPFTERLARVLDALLCGLDEVGEKSATMIPRLDVLDLGWHDGRLILTGVRDVYLSHPAVDIADFVVSLKRNLGNRMKAETLVQLLQGFKQDILNCGEITAHELTLFEAVANVRSAAEYQIRGERKLAEISCQDAEKCLEQINDSLRLVI